MADTPVTVFIEGLDVYAYHGVSDEEQAIGHRLVFDLSLDFVTEATTSDSIDDTISYAEVAAMVAELTTAQNYRTLERLAHVVGAQILGSYPGLQTLTVSVRKIAPPMPAIAAATGVRMTLSRGLEIPGNRTHTPPS